MNEVLQISSVFQEISGNFKALSESGYAAGIARANALLIEAFRSGGKLLVFGNGGSAADAQHICGELVGRFNIDRPGLPAIALGCNPALVTAWGNDHSFETIFERQIQAFGKPGDVAWAISTSGNS